MTMHPHGVFYDTNSEGVAVQTASGETHVYTWYCPDRAGPGPADGPSKLWLYHRCVSCGVLVCRHAVIGGLFPSNLLVAHPHPTHPHPFVSLPALPG